METNPDLRGTLFQNLTTVTNLIREAEGLEARFAKQRATLEQLRADVIYRLQGPNVMVYPAGTVVDAPEIMSLREVLAGTGQDFFENPIMNAGVIQAPPIYYSSECGLNVGPHERAGGADIEENFEPLKNFQHLQSRNRLVSGLSNPEIANPSTLKLQSCIDLIATEIKDGHTDRHDREPAEHNSNDINSISYEDLDLWNLESGLIIPEVTTEVNLRTNVHETTGGKLRGLSVGRTGLEHQQNLDSVLSDALNACEATFGPPTPNQLHDRALPARSGENLSSQGNLTAYGSPNHTYWDSMPDIPASIGNMNALPGHTHAGISPAQQIPLNNPKDLPKYTHPGLTSADPILLDDYDFNTQQKHVYPGSILAEPVPGNVKKARTRKDTGADHHNPQAESSRRGNRGGARGHVSRGSRAGSTRGARGSCGGGKVRGGRTDMRTDSRTCNTDRTTNVNLLAGPVPVGYSQIFHPPGVLSSAVLGPVGVSAPRANSVGHTHGQTSVGWIVDSPDMGLSPTPVVPITKIAKEAQQRGTAGNHLATLTAQTVHERAPVAPLSCEVEDVEYSEAFSHRVNGVKVTK